MTLDEEITRIRAEKRFGRLNGWRESRQFFCVAHLAKNSRAGYYDEPRHELFDHARLYMKDRRPVAILTMPYDYREGPLQALAANYGLTLHMPPKRNQGWHYPGWTEYCVLTRPDVVVVHWLPEQL